jgi:hypothetical protein
MLFFGGFIMISRSINPPHVGKFDGVWGLSPDLSVENYPAYRTNS